jgi:hypothetical protein
MLSLLLGWIPVVGPFIKAGLAAWEHSQDAGVQRAQIAANKDVALDTDSVDIIRTRAQAAQDIGVQFARDLLLNWYAIYVSLIFYRSCFHHALPENWTWEIDHIPADLNYLCMAMIAYLFYTAWRGGKG